MSINLTGQLNRGVSYSLLSDFMTCRQKAKFRLERVKPMTTSLALTYGSLVHDVLDKCHIGIALGEITKIPGEKRVHRYIDQFCDKWLEKNPRATTRSVQDLELSRAYAKAVVPTYFKFWGREGLFEMQWDASMTEQFYRFEFQISGQTIVPMLVKMDGVFWAPKKLKKKTVIRPWLFETKCFSMFNEYALTETLPISLQNNIYLIALWERFGKKPAGVMYNILRRPQLRQKKTESDREFIQRIREDVKSRPEFYFIRLKIDAKTKDIQNAKGDLQGQLLDLVKWAKGERMHFRNTESCNGKYGLCDFVPICARDDWSYFIGGKGVRTGASRRRENQ